MSDALQHAFLEAGPDGAAHAADADADADHKELPAAATLHRWWSVTVGGVSQVLECGPRAQTPTYTLQAHADICRRFQTQTRGYTGL